MHLDLTGFLCLTMQLRHQGNLGVPQRNDAFVHLRFLLTNLAKQTQKNYYTSHTHTFVSNYHHFGPVETLISIYSGAPQAGCTY